MIIKERQSKILKIPKEYMVKNPPAPKSAKIELVSRCNYRCKFCAFALREEQPNQDMNHSLFKNICEELKSVGVEEIGLFYIGESFLNPDLLYKAIKFCKNKMKFPYVFLTSNASMALPQHVERCMKAGLDSLKWSCNFSGIKQFEEYAGVNPNMLEMAKENIKAAFEIRNRGNYHTKLYASSIRYDDKQIGEMENFLNQFIVPYVDWNYWLPLYTAGGEAKIIEKSLDMKPMAGNPGRWDDPSDPLPCWTIFTAAHILYDGRVSACCLDGSGHWVMGNMRTQKFMDIWNSQEFQELRQAHLNKDVSGTKCEQCVLI